MLMGKNNKTTKQNKNQEQKARSVSRLKAGCALNSEKMICETNTDPKLLLRNQDLLAWIQRE